MASQIKNRSVFVSGNFNILHTGHLRLLSYAKEYGELLIIGLFDDEQPGVLLPYDIRYETLKSLAFVSDIIKISCDSLIDTISSIKPEIVVKGKEHEDKFNVEYEIVKSYGGDLIFSSGSVNFSSLELINKSIDSLKTISCVHDIDYLRRHGTSLTNLKSIIKKFTEISALTIGESIVDEYVDCEPVGMSQEDPTIVVTPIKSTKFIGGAAIVSGHVSGLNSKSNLVTLAGDDVIASELALDLKAIDVNASIVHDTSRPTILKQRFRATNKTLLRVSHFREHDISHEISSQLYFNCEFYIKDISLIIFSDFNYGCLPQTLVNNIISLCKSNNLEFIADSQSSSQVGDISRFTDALLISATEREARLALNDFKSGLQDIANRLLHKANAKNLLLKLGAEGVIVVSSAAGVSTDRLAAMNNNPVDVAGAGDAMLVATGLALTVGATIWEAAYIGSLAAAIQVSRKGNVPLQRDLLYQCLSSGNRPLEP